MAADGDWFFTHEQLEEMSQTREDGISETEEHKWRHETIDFMYNVGRVLRLPQLTIATASVFFYRFFVKNSMMRYDRFVREVEVCLTNVQLVSIAALFLAAKVEESLRKLKDVLKTALQLTGRTDIDFETDEFKKLREKVLYCERVMLQTLNFDLSVTHPYKHLLVQVKNVGGTRDLAQVAWNFVNDSLRTNLCLQHPPEVIAKATIVLGATILSIDLKEEWSTDGDISRVANAILDVYPESDIKKRDVMPQPPAQSVGKPPVERTEARRTESVDRSKSYPDRPSVERIERSRHERMDRPVADKRMERSGTERSDKPVAERTDRSQDRHRHGYKSVDRWTNDRHRDRDRDSHKRRREDYRKDEHHRAGHRPRH